MNAFIPASALALALAGTVVAAPVAVPVAPAPRPVAPKFVAPKFNNSFEILVFAAQRPVRIRAAVLAEGKPAGDLWGDRLKRMFDFCDRDGDGTLSEKEIRFAFTDQGMVQLLAGGIYQVTAANPPTLAKYDKNGDGKVTFDEFAAAYTVTGGQLIRPLGVQPDVGNNAPITEAVFKLLDADGDGKLTKAEVRAVEKLLASRDADEDECLNIQELAPNAFNPNVRRLGQPVPAPPNGAYPAPVGSQMVSVFESGRVPGTVTQQVIKKYDKDNDFELTRAECGFDDAQFRALDKDGNGKLDGEELDVWRTGAPDLDLTLSLAARPNDCVAKLTDPAAAEARGLKVKQSESGRLVLHVGRQTVDLSAFATAQFGQQALKVQYGYLFTQAAGGKDHVTEKDLAGPNAVQFQFVRVMFDPADRDADGKLTKTEFDAYFDLQDGFRNLGMSLTPTVQTPSLFQLLDENRDGRLSVRELRTAWDRLLVLEAPGAEVVTRGIIQPSVAVRLSRSFDRNNNFAPPVVVSSRAGMGGPPAAQANGPLWFRKMDRNADGDLSRTEFVGTKAEFDAIDTDADDLISLQEAEAWDKKMREK